MTCNYQCMSCKFEWNGTPGPTQCPRCSHVFIDWKNHEEVLEQIRKKEETR